MAFDSSKYSSKVRDNYTLDLSLMTKSNTYQVEVVNYKGGGASTVFGLCLYLNNAYTDKYFTKIRTMVKDHNNGDAPNGASHNRTSNAEFMMTPLLFMLPDNALSKIPCMLLTDLTRRYKYYTIR